MALFDTESEFETYLDSIYEDVSDAGVIPEAKWNRYGLTLSGNITKKQRLCHRIVDNELLAPELIQYDVLSDGRVFWDKEEPRQTSKKNPKPVEKTLRNWAMSNIPDCIGTKLMPVSDFESAFKFAELQVTIDTNATQAGTAVKKLVHVFKNGSDPIAYREITE